MKILTQPAVVRAVTLIGFLSFAVAAVFYMLTRTGINMPWEDVGHYEIVMETNDVDNLEKAGHVRIAGVKVGEIESREVAGDRARVVLSLFDKYAPLHKGATVRIGAKSLVEETYLDITDGDGPTLPSGTTLPAQAVRTSTQLDDVLHGLDPHTREALGAFLRSAGKGTQGTKADTSAMLAGLGDLGRKGSTALDALAAQSDDLRALARETTVLLTALDAGEGQIAAMVDGADRLTEATSGQRQAIEATMRRLPGVLDSTRSATGSLTKLSGALAPVAADLNRAAAPLSAALRELPATSRDLRKAMPPLRGTLDGAPRTLDRVPRFGQDLRGLLPNAQEILRDVNPMLAYMRPYSPELAAFIANFNAMGRYTDEAGVHYFRAFAIHNDSGPSLPVEPGYLGAYKNAIPKPGSGGAPGEFTGDYPRVEREPR